MSRLVRCLAHIGVTDRLLLVRTMRHVETRDIHAGCDERTDRVKAFRCRTEGAHDFGATHWDSSLFGDGCSLVQTEIDRAVGTIGAGSAV